MVLSSELRFNQWQWPLGSGLLQLTPYLTGSYDTEFTPSVDPETNKEKALQRDLDGIAGLVLASSVGPLREVKAGALGHFDLSALQSRPGVQLALSIVQRLSPDWPITLKAGADLRQYLTVVEPRPDQLSFLGDLNAGLVVPIWQNLTVTIGLNGLVYRGQAAPADAWGYTLNPSVGLSYGGTWKPQWGVLY